MYELYRSIHDVGNKYYHNNMIINILLIIKQNNIFLFVNKVQYVGDWMLMLVLVHVRSHIGWSGERNIPYKSVETSP